MTTHPKVYLGVLSAEGEWMEREPIALYSQNQIGDSIVTVREYSALRFRFESSDPNDELLVETYESESFHTVKPGGSLLVKKGGDSDQMLVPGDYPVIVRTSGGIYETLYRIQPQSMSWEQLMNLRTYLEQKMTGLAFNILKRRSGGVGSERDPIPHSLKSYQHIQKNMNKLRQQLESILKDPLKDVVQEYDQRTYSRRPDGKSQRWMTKRGSAKNANPLAPAYFYEKHARLTEDTAENRWIKYVVRSTKQELKKVQQSFELNRSEQKSRMAAKMKQLADFRARYSRITTQFGFDDLRHELRALINHNEQELLQLQETIGRIDDNLGEVNKYVAQFSRYEQADSLNKVAGKLQHKKPTPRLLKDPRYSSVYRFYKELESMETRESNKKTAFPYKKTSLLFEYYVLCLVIDMLEESGFNWTAGWLADYANPEIAIGSLASETLLRFDSENGDYYIELAYDTQILDTGDESVSHFKANIKRAPDLRVSIYKSSGEFLDTVILDAKYRRYAYLWNDHEENDVMRQLNDYLRIWHYDVQKPVRSRMKRDAVSKVIAVYPQQSGANPFFEKMDKTLAFVQVAPADPAKDEEPYGYRALKGLIDEFLKNAMEDWDAEVN